MMMKKVTRTGLLTLLSILWAQAGFATPNADFTSATVSGCVPLNIRFDNLSTGAGPLTYQWIFNPGNIVSNYVNPVMTFNRPGSYTVTLIARESNGQSDTLTISNFITVHDTPVAAFTGNGSLAQCLDGNIFHFDNQQQPGETYLWDFNDGTTSTIADPDHTFTQAGQYNITLLTTNGFGCTDQITRPAYVTVFPEPDATVNANTTFSCNTNTVFQFNTSTNGITSYRWNFGDGRSSTSASPSHQYTSPGSYNVSVILTSDHGCIDTTEVPLNIRIGAGYYVSIGVDEDSVCMGQPITFRNPNYNIAACTWNLGDGTTSGNVIPPPHVYANPGTYQVQLLITDSTGCQFSATRQVTVFPKPQVSFNISNQMGCAPFRVTFGNLTTGYDSCQWLFGDGGTSFDRSATVNYTYYAAGTFSVTLKCWNSNGCSETIVLRDTIRVSNLQAGFISDVRMGCPPMQVQFTSVSQGNNMSYNWNFGNGTNSTQANPSVSFPNAGTYPVTLVVSDGICMDTTFRNNYIQTLDPTANYIAPDTTVGCAPLTTQFTDATLGAISWRWDFGDGTSSNQQNPYHTYTRPGLYSVSLQTISAGGSCVKTIDNFRTFHVLGGWAGFDHEITSICPPYSAQFTDTSNNAVSWLWDFGDGTTDTSRNPSHVFTVGGYHSVRLTITTADGCTYSTMQTNGIYFPPFGANFYAITSGNTLPVDVQFFANSAGATGWFWDFADGRTSTLENPLVHFNAQPSGSITLTIVSDLCTLTYSTPLINFGIPDTTPVDLGNPGAPENQIGCSPLSVSFSQAFQVANAAQYYWNFGDGHTSTERFPTHTYTETGNYNVSIQFFDAAGNWLDSIGSVGSVSVRGPTAGFSIIQSNCQAGQVDFADSSRNANSWFWDFGDGNTSTDTVPHHSYAGSVSNYIVTQTVTDTNGCSNSISALMFANTQSPVLVTETDICGLDTVHFFTSQVNYASYVWHFGDGTSDTSANPSHVYTIEGVFTPRLVTTDLNGCTKEYFAPAITVSLPTADFTTSARQGCDRLNVAFFNHSLNADSLNCVYEWDFGDGNYSNAIEPVHRYMGAGTYTVTLTVYKGNCISRETRPNHIKVDTAFAGFVATPLNRCMPMSVQFTNYSANAVSYHWDFGDGTTDTIADPLHVFNSYTYTNMVLAIVDANGCRDTARRLQFTPMNPEFTIDAVKGCIPFTVHFDDNTAMVSSYLWDFGDGSTSTLADPAHTYYQSGTYDIRLIVTSGSAPGGCSDTVYMPAYIKAVDPVADFRTNDTLICAPGEVHFTDLSRDGDAYLWDFGDGTTSNRSDSISHIYNLPGVYTVTLTVSSDAGCSHSKTISQYIRVYGSTSMFEASAYEGCAPFTVDFTDLSSQNSIAWEYTFGDGGSDTISDPTHTFLSGGVYNVRLLTRDEHGCGSYYELPDPIIVHEQPIADFSISDTVGCQPFVLDLTNHSTGYEYLSWDFGNGMTDSSFEPEFAYVQTGSFNVSLIAYNTYGCADTMHHPSNITVQLTPVPSFTVGMTTGCIGLTTQFSSNSTNISNPVYFWDFGNNSTSDQPSVSVTYDRPGNYTVSLEVTNDNGCSAETTLTGLIHVYDTVPPSKTVVNSVSVEDNTHVKIIWQNNPDLDLFSYVVYRLNRGANLYEAVHTQPASNNSFALTSSWTDEGLNTLSETYSYKVQAVDVCGYYYPLDSLTAHTTINVSSEEAGNHIAVSWTSYGGCQVGTYKIFRAAPGESMEYLATVPGDNLDYLDSTFSCPYPYSYRIMATDLCGTLYTSYSDTSVTMPKNIYDGQVVDVVRSTVVDNRYVLTEWKETTVLPESVVAYEIYRSTDNQEYSFLMSVPAQQTDLQDYDVDVQTTRYYYRIKVVNRCDVDMGLSKTTSTIILNGNMDEGRRVYLDWTPYSGWENGVEYYILEKQDANGNWIFLRQVTGQVTNYDYQE